MPRKMRIQSLMLVLAILAGAVISAVPASAAVVPGTAGFAADGTGTDYANVISGTPVNIAIEVTNGGNPAGDIPPLEPAEGSAINWVRIGSDTPGAFTIQNGGSEGWLPDTDSEGNARFRNGTIEPGDSQTFTVNTTAAAVAEDTVSDWIVEVSDDNGRTITKQAPAGIGALTTTIRVLSLDSAQVSAPVGVLDGTATAGQENIHVQSVVDNHGTAPLTVTPTLTSDALGDSITSVTPASATINPNDPAQTFDFTIDLGNVSSRSFTADASAPGASTPSFVTSSLTAQAAAAFAYAGGSLSPQASASGASPTFTVSLNKSNPPAVTLDPATTVLTFTKQSDSSQTFSTNLAGPVTAANDAAAVGLTFNPVTIPGPLNADGIWTPSLTLNGTDDNGAPVSRTVSITDAFEIDNLVPVIVATLSPQGGAKNEGDLSVTKNGTQLNIGGTVKRGAGDTALSDPTATVVQCDLVVLNDALVAVNRISVPIGASGCRNNAGSLAGSISPAELGTPTGFVRLEVAARDVAGNTSTAQPSDLVAVDNVAPSYYSVVTGCGAQGRAADPSCADLNTVRVFLKEGVKGTFAPTDFTVASQLVTRVATRYIATYATDASGNKHPNESAAGTQCAAPSPTPTNPMPALPFCNVAILTLAPSQDDGTAISSDSTPITQFKFANTPTGAPSLRNRPVDAPGTPMLDWSTTAIDGIVPDLPSLGGVSQTGLADDGTVVQSFKGEQGDGFYTNETSPTFRITGLAAGYTGIIAIDGNGDGDYDAANDLDVARCIAGATTVDCTTTNGLSSNTTNSILVTALDPQGNLAEGTTGDLNGKHARPATLFVDQIAPAAGTFTAALATRNVTLEFSEALAAGRDFAEDWFVYVRLNGVLKRLVVGDVSGTGDSRDVHIANSEDRFNGTVDVAKYSYNGLPSGRYQDKAGNYLADFLLP